MNQSVRHYRDVFSIIGLLIVVWAVTTRLASTNWTDHLSVIQISTMLAALAGFLVGISHFTRRTSHAILAAISLFVLAWQISSMTALEGLWSERGIEILQRTMNALRAFVTNQPVSEPTLFLIGMLLLFWLAALTAGFRLARAGRPWVPLLVMAFILLIMNVYPPVTGASHFYSAVTAIALLILLSRLFYLQHQRKWRADLTTIDYGVDLDILKSAAITALFLVLVAWSIPAMRAILTPDTAESTEIRDLWQPLQERMSNMFNSLRRQPGTRADFYGPSMALGLRATEGDELLFSVRTDPPKPKGIRFYWRSASYDLYRDGQWISTVSQRERLEPADWSDDKPNWSSRQEIELSITSQTLRTNNVYSLGYPLSVGEASERLAQWISEGNSASQLLATTPTPHTVSASDAPEQFADIVSIESQLSIARNETYKVESWLAVPGITQMRTAPAEYPPWVTERYLQLPENLPERVKLLAKEMAEGQTNNFDRAMEITRFLRSEMTYSDSAPQPPEGYDAIDWFLFESKTGFCNYYASAEVILLRSLGIPARLVAGFSEGDYDPETDSYQVRIGHSHAWPEAYFPGLGWIEFEPTASEPLPAFLNPMVSDSPALNFVIEDYISEPSSAEARYQERMERLREVMMDDELYMEDMPFVAPQTGPSRGQIILVSLAGVALLLVLLTRLPVFRRRPIPVLVDRFLTRSGGTSPVWIRQMAHRSRMTDMERTFSQLDWMDFLLNGSSDAAHTPLELVNRITAVVPEVREPLQVLLDEYEMSSYGPNDGDLAASRRALWQAWRAVLRKWINRLIYKPA